MQLVMKATTVPGLFVARHGSCLHLLTSDIEHISDDQAPIVDWLGQLDKHGNYAVLNKEWLVELDVKSDYSYVADQQLVDMIEEDY